jgi:hypothetical protein
LPAAPIAAASNRCCIAGLQRAALQCVIHAARQQLMQVVDGKDNARLMAGVVFLSAAVS